MAKKSYIGVDNVARNVKKLYIGVDNVARNVVKAYIGVNGIARQFFTSIAMEFIGRNNTDSNGGYGIAVTKKEGNSLYASASGATVNDVHVDVFWELRSGGGVRYKIPAGSTITFTMRSEIASTYNCLTCLRLEDMSGNWTYPYKNVTVTNETFTVSKDSYLIFLAEISYSDETDYARFWIDRFELNGLKVI